MESYRMFVFRVRTGYLCIHSSVVGQIKGYDQRVANRSHDINRPARTINSTSSNYYVTLSLQPIDKNVRTTAVFSVPLNMKQRC